MAANVHGLLAVQDVGSDVQNMHIFAEAIGPARLRQGNGKTHLNCTVQVSDAKNTAVAYRTCTTLQKL
jgi:hypothetical protein